MTRSIENSLIEKKLAELDEIETLIARRDALKQADRERARLASELAELERAESQNREAAIEEYREALARYEAARDDVFALWRDDTIPATYDKAVAARRDLEKARSALGTFSGITLPPPPPRAMYVLAKDDDLRRAKKRWDEARRREF